MLIGSCLNPSWIGDLYCDDENNHIDCYFDGGDCCGSNVDTTYCQECLCLNDTITLPPTTDDETTSRIFKCLHFLFNIYLETY